MIMFVRLAANLLKEKLPFDEVLNLLVNAADAFGPVAENAVEVVVLPGAGVSGAVGLRLMIAGRTRRMSSPASSTNGYPPSSSTLANTSWNSLAMVDFILSMSFDLTGKELAERLR